MGNKITDELLSTVRSIVGPAFSDMDIIRSLHLANNDVTGAINIMLDSPKRKTPKPPQSESKPQPEPKPKSEPKVKPKLEENNLEATCTADCKNVVGGQSFNFGDEWWYVGSADVAGLSTCRGGRVKAGDEVSFKFPSLKSKSPTSPSPRKGGFGKGKLAVAGCSEIVRFSVKDSGEIGRIPNEWARCILPLMRDHKIRINGCCESAPQVLGIMDTIHLSISIYINSTMYRKHHQTSLKAAMNATEESAVHPLPNLFLLLGLTPLKKAELAPTSLNTRKRPLASKDGSCFPASLLHASNSNNPPKNGNEVENEEPLSDADLDNIVGVGCTCELEETDPRSSLQCELRTYQKQALHWMLQLEKGKCRDEAATIIHPCWEAYRLADKRELVMYLNAFTGEATTEFPSALQMAKGGILADAMGLGKTIMTISLLLAHSDRDGSPSSPSENQPFSEGSGSDVDQFPTPLSKAAKFSAFEKIKKKKKLVSGFNLIVCPMTLLGQWKAEIETHAQPGSLSIYVHYGQSRTKDAKVLVQSNVVITTYGVLASEFSAENAEDGVLYSIHWFRVVLDEAHTIKSSKSQISVAAAALVAYRRWCLTGTPIQNNLEDIYSLLRFLKVEPWENWAWYVDEYFLDGKHITKTEVLNLLESAGFSRSNPYYVVQQGKIASLTLMKDSERLDLLKEIGGTRVYEERCRESLKIMHETGNKRKQIIQVVQYLDERLKELDEEKEELRKYQQLDKQRKSLEYTIYDKELHDAQEKLAEVEKARNNVSNTSAHNYNNVLDSHERSKDLDKMLKDLGKELQGLNKEKEAKEKRQAEVIKKQTELEHDVKDMQERISGNIQAKEDALKQLRALQKEIKDSMKELDKISPLYENQAVKEKEITKGIMEREKQLSILYQKQGRATQFSSKAARDKWLQKEIDDLQRVVSSNLIQEGKLLDEIHKLHEELKKQDTDIEGRRADIKTLESLISQSREGFNSHKAQRDKLLDELMWAKENELTAEIDKLKAEVEKAEKSLDHATPGDVRRGLNSIRRICREYNIRGVFGPLIELLDCDEKFFTAVEVTAGNSLFHVVVENYEISTQIIRHLNALKGGRVTFIPLNRVKAPHVTYPQNSDVIPLMKRLKYSPNYHLAFAQVFARTVICRDLDVATRVARIDGLDCITMEGDQVSKKGGMTGVFYDHRRSKLKFMSMIVQNTKSIQMKEVELEEVRKTLQDIDQKITELVTEQQKIDPKGSHDKSELEQFKQDIANANKQKEFISLSLGNKEKSLADVRMHIEQLKSSMDVKQTEMGTELIDHLTPQEKELLSRLNPEIAELKEDLISCRTDRIETETRKAELEANLTTNLKRRKQELEAIVSAAETDALPSEAELKKQELKEAELLVEDMTRELESVTKSIDEKTEKLKRIKDEKIELKEDEYELTLQEEAKALEQLLSDRSLYLAKQEEYSNKIRELGPLSSDAFETYKRRSIKELHKMLHRCNEQLQQFSHVNKKALDQYVNFTEQREELQKRQAELDEGDEKIKELISALDQRKDESIERTFKGVARHFREVFSELVQGGHGHLVMMKKKDGDHGDDDHDDGPSEADAEGRVEKYIGVKVKVSFTGQGETQSMKQLSGGQKTVVALTLIFAIQRCDPAPFYLFDEIDAALDPQYRTAVGNMIRRLADMANTQFITTTFRPELVKVADKIYGVTHKNRVSFANVIHKDDALDFIEHDQSHNAE